MLTVLGHFKMVLQSGCTVLNLQGDVRMFYCFTPLPAFGVPGFSFLKLSYFNGIGGSVSS